MTEPDAPSFDVVVAGNGILGLATARALIADDPALAVAVVGPATRPGGASAAAGAMLGCFGEVTRYTLGSPAGRAKFELARQAAERWPGFLDSLDAEVSDEPGVRRVDGTHVLLNARSGPLDSDNFTAAVSALVDHGEPHELDGPVEGLVANPDARPLRTVFIPGEGAVDGSQVLRRLEVAAVRAGVTIVDGLVDDVDVRQGRVTGVRLAGGRTVACARVVVALGASTSPLLARVLPPGEVQPVLAGSGVGLVAERVLGTGFRSVVRTVNRAGSCGLHVIPLDGAREYLGATNVVFRLPELRAHLGVVHFLAGCAMDQLDTDLCYSRIDEVRIGNRPVPIDTFPLLGGTSVDGLSVLTGTYRDGFHCAPVIAERAVALVREGRNAFDAAFSPTRRPHGHATVARSIDDFVGEALSSAVENGTRLSTFMRHDDLEAVFRPKAEAVYERVGTAVALAPDLLNHLALSRKHDDDVEALSRYLRG